MRFAFAIVLGASALAASALGACSSSDIPFVPDHEGGGSSGGSSGSSGSSSGSSSSGGSGSSSGATACPSSCTTNTQCNPCASAGQVFCCEMRPAGGVCGQSATGSCASTVPDAGNTNGKDAGGGVDAAAAMTCLGTSDCPGGDVCCLVNGRNDATCQTQAACNRAGGTSICANSGDCTGNQICAGNGAMTCQTPVCTAPGGATPCTGNNMLCCAGTTNTCQMRTGGGCPGGEAAVCMVDGDCPTGQTCSARDGMRCAAPAPPVDAGVRDSGAGGDAGTRTDAGSPVDAGAPTDARPG